MSADRETYEHRVDVFRGALATRGLEGAVVSWGPHVRYLSGIVSEWSPAFLVVDAEWVSAIVPASTGIAALPGVYGISYRDSALGKVIDPRRIALDEVSRALDDRGLWRKPFGVERDDLRRNDVFWVPIFEEAPDIGHLLVRQRSHKDAEEIARIRANLRILGLGFDAARETIRPGVTELAVWAAMHAAMMAAAGAPFVLEGNFASGPRTLEAEPQATNRQLEKGDVVLIDIYPVIDGYSADLARVFVVGQPSEARRARHAVLERALAAGVAALKPGVRASEVDRAVRQSIAEALGGYTFPHHAGHALGMQSQERPMLIPAEETVIEAGMVIAIEPGAYLPDTGGMRIEGNYLVTETGCESLADYPLELFACG